MKEERFHVDLDDSEHSIVIDSLNEKKKSLTRIGKTTDAVDELIVKIGFAPIRKYRVVKKDRNHETAR